MLFSVLRTPVGRVGLSKATPLARVIPSGVTTALLASRASRSFWSTAAVMKEVKETKEKKIVKTAAKPKAATKAEKPVVKKIKKVKVEKVVIPRIKKKDITPPFPPPPWSAWTGFITQYLRQHSKKGERVAPNQFGDAVTLYKQLSDAEKDKYKATEAERAEYRKKLDAWLESLDGRTRKAYKQSKKRGEKGYTPSAYTIYVKENYESASGTTFSEKTRSNAMGWNNLSESEKQAYSVRAQEARDAAKAKAEAEAKAAA